MDCSLDDARELLRQWNSNNSVVRLSFVGRGLKISYSQGRITDVTGTQFTFASQSKRVEFDTGTSSKTQLLSLGSDELPEMVKELSSETDECALVLIGALGDILVILKEKRK